MHMLRRYSIDLKVSCNRLQAQSLRGRTPGTWPAGMRVRCAKNTNTTTGDRALDTTTRACGVESE